MDSKTTYGQHRRAALAHIKSAMELVSHNDVLELLATTFAQEARKYPDGSNIQKANYDLFNKLWDIANPKM